MTEPAQKFREILDYFEEAMLVTRSTEGYPHARPMAIADKQQDGDLWFVTVAETGKVEELAKDPRAAAVMSAAGRYLSISGEAEVVDDRRRIDNVWMPSWKSWFPKGKDDPALVLIHLRAHRAEYWDQRTTKAFRYRFRAARAILRGRQPDEAPEEQHGEVKL